MPPENAFCCKSGPLPLSFCHLLSLLPRSTLYVPFPASGSANPLLTSFLTAQALNLIYSSTDWDEPPALSREFMRSFKAIVQTTKITFHPSSSAPASTSSSRTRSQANATAKPALNEEGYFVPVGGGEDKYRPKEAKRLFGDGKWRRISKWDAEECLRLPGSGIEIGDGEKWELLDGVEKLWCKNHGVWWEVRVWVRVS